MCGGDVVEQCAVRLAPRAVTAAMMTTAMRATMRPYSTAVAPRSSRSCGADLELHEVLEHFESLSGASVMAQTTAVLRRE